MKWWSDLLDISTEDHVYREAIRCARLHETSRELALPNTLDPLANALQCIDVLQERVDAGWLESELDHLLLACVEGALRVVALKVLILLLNNIK